MTVSVACADAGFGDRRVFSASRIGLLLARHLLLATVATATVGMAVTGFTLGVSWLLAAPPAQQEHAYFGLRTIARVSVYPGAPAPPAPREVADLSPASADVAPPPSVVERMPEPDVIPPAPPNAVPMPPNMPPEIATLRAAPRVASLPPVAAPRADKPAARPLDSRTAVYDITARIVYLPSGKTLEAHSGLGELRDDPRHVRTKNRGATPPNTYTLSLREALFHGVRAIRLTPVDEDKMFGRDGILAHTYLLGPEGDSNGCVSFKDYDAFLQAYLRGEVERLVVVATNGAAVAQAAHGRRNVRYASSDS